MADAPVVEPIDPNNPGATPAPEVTPQGGDENPGEGQGLPPALIKMPVMQALTAGSPPAVSANIKEFAKNPDAKVLAANKDALLKAGFGFYRSLSGDIGVIFNQLHLHPEDIQAADKAGQLSRIAPPFNAVDHAISKAGTNHPALHAQTPGGPASRVSTAPPQFASGLAPAGAGPATGPSGPPMPLPASGAPPGVQQQAFRAKIAGLNPGAPTSGPAPGAGRLLNSIMRPAV